MKMLFESAAHMRQVLPVWKKFKVERVDYTIWSTEQQKFIPAKDPRPTRAALEEGNTVFVYDHGRRRYGFRYTDDVFCRRYAVHFNPDVTDAVLWERRVRNVLKKLTASGLWPEVKKEFEQLLEIGYDRRQRLMYDGWPFEAQQPYWNAIMRKEPDAAEKFNAEFERHHGELMNEIPFAFYKSEDGLWYKRSVFINEMSEARTKSMYFGKHYNRWAKDEFAKAIQEKRRYLFETRTHYDVTLQYNPETNMAWYAEEYRDCGNGHYYIAIDSNTALFCEDD